MTVFAGVFGALAAWITSLRNRRQLRELKDYIERLPALLEDIKKQPAAGLSSAQDELDRLSDWFVEKYVADQISPDLFNIAATRLTHLKDLIRKRREAGQGVVGEQVKSDEGKKESSVVTLAS